MRRNVGTFQTTAARVEIGGRSRAEDRIRGFADIAQAMVLAGAGMLDMRRLSIGDSQICVISGSETDKIKNIASIG
jgi:hypothetical protein